MRCCVGDEGLLALRIRPAEGGSKPPAAALAEDCRGERCGKRRTGCVRWGLGRRSLFEVSKVIRMTSKPRGSPIFGMSLAGARLLARRCPAYRRREPGQAAFVWNGRERAPTLSLR